MAYSRPMPSSSDGTSRGERYFVYCRFWPGFTDGFPFDRFDGLPDTIVESELRDALATELWQSRHELYAKRREDSRRRAEAFKRLISQSIAPSSALCRRKAPLHKLRPTRTARFVKMACLVGWHRGGGPIDFVISPRVWIAELESPEIANDLVDWIAGLRLPDDKEFKWLNPRYGSISAHDLAPGEQASVREAIMQLCGNEPIDWCGEIVRQVLPRVGRFLAEHPNVTTSDTGGEAGDGSPAAENAEQPSLEARALALLTDHPDWTDTRIAKAVPCSRQSLYRFQRYVAARELLRQSGKASHARGRKTDGHLEAWEAGE